jgi:arylsulfatase A-like enzyme
MNRNLLALLLLGTIASQSATAAQPKQPNIVVFLVDDMGVMDTSVPFLTDDDGKPVRHPLNDWYRTPNMERLADKGIRFNNFYAMSVCSPTRISIMTGQNSSRHHATNWINPWMNNAGTLGPSDWRWEGLKEGDTTLPGQLRKSGYRTIHVGKAHFGPEETQGAEPLNLGFDVNIAGAAFGAPGSYYAEKNYGLGTKRDKSAVPHLDKYHGTDTFLTEALTIEAKKVLAETVKGDQPFYLYFSHYAVHAPFESDPRFAANYADSDKPTNAKAFATLIEGMDKSLGDMLDQLDELGVAENTLVIFLGDNGSDAPLGQQHEVACAAPLRGKKGAHYEGGMRVPFIAAWASPNSDNPFQKRLSIPAGQIQPQLAAAYDLYPTILDLVGATNPPKHSLDGTNIATLLSGKPDPAYKEVFLMHYPHGPHRSSYFTTYRDEDWKVIYHSHPNAKTSGDHIQSGGEHYQLFNLARDPYEQDDLARTNPAQLTRMMRSLIKTLEDQNAQYPIDENGNELRPHLP